MAQCSWGGIGEIDQVGEEQVSGATEGELLWSLGSKKMALKRPQMAQDQFFNDTLTPLPLTH
jgi:hypothetical protein